MCDHKHPFSKKGSIGGPSRVLAGTKEAAFTRSGHLKRQQYEQFINGLINDSYCQSSAKRFPKIGMEQAKKKELSSFDMI